MSAAQHAANIAYAALREVGRDDLADLVCFFIDVDGSVYLEPLDEVTCADLALIERAERLALEVVHSPISAIGRVSK